MQSAHASQCIAVLVVLLGLSASPSLRAQPGRSSTMLTDCKAAIETAEGRHPSRETIEGRLASDKQMTSSISCMAYVAGFVSATRLYGNRLGVCLPEEMDGVQAVRVYVNYMQKHPEVLHLPPGALLHWAIESAFPCASR